MADFLSDLEASKRVFLAHFDAVSDEYGRATQEAEQHQAALVEAQARQEGARSRYNLLVTSAEAIGLNLNELIEARQKAEALEAAAPVAQPVVRIDMSAPVERPTVRDFVLHEAEKAFPGAVRAATLRTRFLEVFGVPVHEKTFGMTLYRLSREETQKMRRQGKQDWYFVPEDPEAAERRAASELFS
jgi:hypothetical protein